MRGLRSTIALLVVLIGLGTYIYYTWDQPASSGTTTNEKLFTVQADQIHELKVTSESGEITSLKKEGDSWQITSPVIVPAADSEVSTLTSTIAGLETTRVVDEKPADLNTFGLLTPRISVEFKTADGKANGQVFIGTKTPT